MDKRSTIKRFTLGLAAIIIILGATFMLLDILDIAESYRLQWPIAVLNTICICVVAVFTIVFATRSYLKSGSYEMLALGSGVLAFSYGVVIYGWLTSANLNTRITAYDSGVLLASIIYMVGAISSITRHIPSVRSKRTCYIIIYAVVLLLISGITWLAYQDVITFLLRQFSEHISARDVVQGIAAVFCISSALIYLLKYRSSHIDVYFWYSLGLVLFTAGVLFISRGHLESRIAWLGRLSQYTGGVAFLAAVLSLYLPSGKNRI
jgi:hypothetical protein